LNKIYFDNAATTPLHPKVLEAMLPYLNEDFGNPSSIHSFGRKVRVEIENARETVAGFINADAGEIYFTSCGTEANNLAIFGIAKTEFSESGRNKIITSKGEHHAVLNAFEQLADEGFNSFYSGLTPSTNCDINDLYSQIDNASLISLIHINNETGSINDIEEISSRIKNKNLYLHSDAVQSFGKIQIDVKKLGVSALSGSGHKIRGPKGIGFAYIKSGTPLSPMIVGGSQERNRRAGTENVAGIIGLKTAIEIAGAEMDDNYKKVSVIKSNFMDGLKSIDSTGLLINGGDNVSPYVLSVTFSQDIYNVDSESMLMFLDINGIAASNGSACTSGTLKPSHVIINSGRSVKDAEGTIRFSFGAQNNEDEVERALDVIQKMAGKFKK